LQELPILSVHINVRMLSIGRKGGKKKAQTDRQNSENKDPTSLDNVT